MSYVDVTLIGGPEDGRVISVDNPTAPLAYSTEEWQVVVYTVRHVRGRWYGLAEGWKLEVHRNTATFTDEFLRRVPGAVENTRGRMERAVAAHVERSGRRPVGGIFTDREEIENTRMIRVTVGAWTAGGPAPRRPREEVLRHADSTVDWSAVQAQNQARERIGLITPEWVTDTLARINADTPQVDWAAVQAASDEAAEWTRNQEAFDRAARQPGEWNQSAAEYEYARLDNPANAYTPQGNDYFQPVRWPEDGYPCPTCWAVARWPWEPMVAIPAAVDPEPWVCIAHGGTRDVKAAGTRAPANDAAMVDVRFTAVPGSPAEAQLHEVRFVGGENTSARAQIMAERRDTTDHLMYHSGRGLLQTLGAWVDGDPDSPPPAIVADPDDALGLVLAVALRQRDQVIGEQAIRDAAMAWQAVMPAMPPFRLTNITEA